MSVFKTQIMSIQVIVENNDLDLALYQLQQKQYFLQNTRWYKKRQGYYEKPSILKRKKCKMTSILCHTYVPQTPYFHVHPKINLWLKIGLAQQHQRTANNLAVGR